MEQDYLIKKPPFQALFIFALPIIIGNLFQQTYTMADSAIVGRFVSEQALAAVGASYSLTNIFICVAIGLSFHGFGISADLFSWVAVSVHVQRVFRHVQCPWKIKNSSRISHFFLTL